MSGEGAQIAMETKVPCSLILPCAVISFSLYEPFSEPEMELWDFHVLSTSKWWISSWHKCCECQAEAAPTIIIIWGYFDQIHLHQPHSAGEMKILYVHFARVFLTFSFCAEHMRRNRILRKAKLTSDINKAKKGISGIFVKNVIVFWGFFIIMGTTFLHAPECL